MEKDCAILKGMSDKTPCGSGDEMAADSQECFVPNRCGRFVLLLDGRWETGRIHPNRREERLDGRRTALQRNTNENLCRRACTAEKIGEQVKAEIPFNINRQK